MTEDMSSRYWRPTARSNIRIVDIFSVVALLSLAGCGTPEAFDNPVSSPAIARFVNTPIPIVATGIPITESGEPDRSPALPAAPDATPAPVSPPQIEDWEPILVASLAVPKSINKTDKGWIGPNGVFASRLGNLIFYYDGSWVRQVGDRFEHSDGTTTKRHGNVYAKLGGRSSRVDGNAVILLNGQHCSFANTQMTCE